MVSNITYFIHTSSEGHVKFNGGEILRRFVTDLRRLLQNIPTLSNNDNADAVATLVADSKLVSVLNGKVASIPSLPKGIEIENFSEQLENDTADAVFAETTFDDAIGQFNSAFVTDGLAIKIAEDADESSARQVC